jgi:hypothetical protein
MESHSPDYSIQRAARDVLNHPVFEVTEDFAGRMFALQDIVDDEELENISEVEKESDSPFFLAIAAAVRKEARTGDPEYARSIAGEFLDQAFRQDIATVRLWQEYQNRSEGEQSQRGRTIAAAEAQYRTAKFKPTQHLQIAAPTFQGGKQCRLSTLPRVWLFSHETGHCVVVLDVECAQRRRQFHRARGFSASINPRLFDR